MWTYVDGFSRMIHFLNLVIYSCNDHWTFNFHRHSFESKSTILSFSTFSFCRCRTFPDLRIFIPGIFERMLKGATWPLTCTCWQWKCNASFCHERSLWLTELFVSENGTTNKAFLVSLPNNSERVHWCVLFFRTHAWSLFHFFPAWFYWVTLKRKASPLHKPQARDRKSAFIKIAFYC